MVDENKNTDRENQDARDFADFLKDARCEGYFNSYISVALSSYMHGVKDASHCFNIAQRVG